MEKIHVGFIVEGYPTEKDPIMPFIKNTVAEMAKQGVRCSVIAPQSFTRAFFHKVPLRPKHWQDIIENQIIVDVYQPYYISFSGRAGMINRYLFFKAAKHAYKCNLKNYVKVLYGHFWHMGVVASKVDSSKPLFVACGESKIDVLNQYTKSDIEKMLNQLTGVIYVSTKSYDEAVKLGLQKEQTEYRILPNGYDGKIFQYKEKKEVRKKIGWDLDWIVAIFVGAFIDRKGPNRVAQALNEINKSRMVFSCFIGTGSLEPICKNQIFIGKVPHDKLSDYLCASDMFVLPTTNEGCCNAIIEAMACGLPIISSNRDFNSDILGDDNSIQIDPMDTSAIQNAILELVNDEKKRQKLSKASLDRAKELNIKTRVENIIEFIRRSV